MTGHMCTFAVIVLLAALLAPLPLVAATARLSSADDVQQQLPADKLEFVAEAGVLLWHG